MKKEFISKSAQQTRKMGEELAKSITKRKILDKAVFIGLQGDLGSGKTTFLQGFAKGLGVEERVLSPTFVILKKFKITKTNNYFANFYHIDCYRLKDEKDILGLMGFSAQGVLPRRIRLGRRPASGWKEFVSCPENIVAIEWSEKIKKIIPKDSLILKFHFIDKNRRRIRIWDGGRPPKVSKSKI